MKKTFLIALTLLFVTIGVLPSTNTSMSTRRISARSEMIDTAAVKSEINVIFNNDCTVKNFSVIAMLKEGAVCPTERLRMLGVTIREEIGRILILTVPAESLMALDDIDEIESVSADQMNQTMNNIAREKSRVTEVATPEKAQQNNLPQAYTGKGVLIGLVDTGIDFNHAAFRNADGSTRIK